eukprot:96227_1
MSVNKAIKFRYLAAQLTNEETHFFINKLIENHTNTILNALFHQMAKVRINDSSENDSINNIISNIILSREKKPKIFVPQNIKLDQIPQKLIGIISSFLNQHEYIHFSQLNRFIYLGCNTPNTLQVLNLRKTKNYSSVNLYLFPSLKELKLNVRKCNQLM